MLGAITLRNLTKHFAGSGKQGDTTRAVDGVTLELGEHEFLTLVGPSGCGKSTIMRLIAGLESPTSGDIFINGQNVNGAPTRARNVGFMFQGYSLFKHMTCADNISFGLKIKKVPKKERQRRVDELVELMGLEGLAARPRII